MNQAIRAIVALFVLMLGVLSVFGEVAQPSAAIAEPAVKTAEPAAHAKERWYVLLMQGKRAGWMKSTERVEGDLVTTGSEMRMSIKRGSLEVKIEMTTEFVETADGKPVSMSSVQKLGAAETRKIATFGDQSLKMVVHNLGQKTERTIALPKKAWLTPAASERYVNQQLAQGAKEITVSTIDPSSGEDVITVTRKVIDEGTVEVFGRVVPSVRWESTIDLYPGIKQVEYVDHAGETLKSVTDVGGLALEQLAADKDLALSKLEAPELLESTTVVPSAPLLEPRRMKTATYRLWADKGEIGEIVSTAGQAVERLTPGSVRVRVDVSLAEPVAAADLAAVKAGHLAPSEVLKADDPEIVKLLDRAGVKGLGSAAAAEKLRQFVHGFVKTKDFSVGFATASEVARTAQGDCTEHAVLLAALLRAAGIGSRCVTGLMYVEQFAGQEGVFGYHMWTQALVETPDGGWGWVNVDAVLPGNMAYDATHIALGVSGMNQGEMQNFLVATAPLIGRLKIDVEKQR